MSKKIKTFVYVETQASIPFSDYSWDKDNPDIRKQPGFISKTWLSGADNNSIGGFYGFDSIDNAKKYATDFMTDKAKKINIGIPTRVFDAERVLEASKEMNSPFFK